MILSSAFTLPLPPGEGRGEGVFLNIQQDFWETSSEMWTSKQRIALSLVITGILILLIFRYYQNPIYFSDPQPPRDLNLLDKLDPNTASHSDLSALPNIGPAMARRIIEDREQFQKQTPNQLPYRQLQDLDRIKGIGPATLENLKPYLMFPPPSSTPDTAPSRQPTY